MRESDGNGALASDREVKEFLCPHTQKLYSAHRASRYPPSPHGKKSIANKSIMKRSIYILTSAVCFALAGGSQVHANLVTNPGFEDAFGTPPEWTWNLVSGTVPTHDRDTGRANSGSYSYKIKGTDAAPSTGYVEQTIYGLPGATYNISGWIYLAFRADRNWAYIQAVGGGATVQAPDKGVNTVGSWVQYTLSQTADGSGILYVRLYLDHYSGTTGGKDNSAYFDDIVVDGPGPEPAKLVYTSVPTTGVAGLPFNVTVQVQDASGHPASVTNTTTVTLSVGSGAGSLGGTTSGDIAIGDSSVTISGVTYDSAGTMTLRATPTAGMTTLTPVTSGNITFAATLDWGPADANWTDANVWRNHSTGTPGTYNDVAHDYVVFEDTHSGTGDRTITLSGTVSPGSISMTALKNFTISGSGTIAGATGLSAEGAGTLTLGTTNTFTGTTRVVAGTLVLANGSALAGSVVDLNSTDVGTLVFGSSVTAASFGGLKGDNTLPLGRDLALTNSSGGAVSLTVGGNNASTSFYGSLSGAGSFTKTGTGVFSLGTGGAGDAWTYDGDTTVSQGTLKLGNSNLLPSGSGKGNLIVNGTVLNEGRTVSVNGLSGTGTLTSGANYDLVVWNLGVNGASSTFDGAITRLPAKNSTLNKLGAGALTLTGTNSAGTTVVSAGTLLVNSPGSLAATNVTVDADATLGGSGTINGSVTVNANGTVSAGASAGILTVTNGLSLGAGATNVWELAANDIVNWGGTKFDQIILTSGSLTLDPTAVLVIKFIGTATTPSLANSFWQYPRQWQIIAGNPDGANFSVIEGTNGITAGTFTTTADATAVTLVYTPSVAPPAPTAVASMNLISLNSTNATLSYSGGTGGQFVLVTSTDVGAALNTWTPVATNVAFSGSFSIPTDVNPQGFYRIISE
jgi:autotransporter-associated beta strand protein